MKKTTLLFAGLLVAGLGLTGCADNTPASTSTPAGTSATSTATQTTAPVTTPTATPTEEEPAAPVNAVIAKATGAIAAFKNTPVTAEIRLVDHKNLIVDCEFPQLGESFATKFDAKGTYKIENGIITSTVKQTPGMAGGQDEVPENPTELVLKFNEEGVMEDFDYVVRGAFEIPLTFKGAWANTAPVATATGAIAAFKNTPVEAAIRLTSSKDIIVDCEFPQLGASFATKFDAKGTYKIVEGKIIAHVEQTPGMAGGQDEVPANPVDMELTFNEEGVMTDYEYTVVGAFEIPLTFKGAFPTTSYVAPEAK